MRDTPRLAACWLAAVLFVPCLAAAQAERTLPTVEVAGARIDVHLMHDAFELDDQALLAWVRRSAEVVGQYYGRFPLAHLDVRLHGAGGQGTRTGNMYPGARPRINIWLGVNSGRADLSRDWVLVHEMVHTAMADVPDRHHWLEEGIAVYVESIARMQAGDLDADFVWGEFAGRMPLGLPGVGDGGLDQTPSWGRTYWGGAVFCLLADLGIRRATDNRMSLRDALRGVLDAGLNAHRDASVREVLQAGDAATGTRVLETLYDEMAMAPVDVDLDAIWARLGVRPSGRRANFDGAAPEAWLREAMSRP